MQMYLLQLNTVIVMSFIGAYKNGRTFYADWCNVELYRCNLTFYRFPITIKCDTVRLPIFFFFFDKNKSEYREKLFH